MRHDSGSNSFNSCPINDLPDFSRYSWRMRVTCVSRQCKQLKLKVLSPENAACTRFFKKTFLPMSTRAAAAGDQHIFTSLFARKPKTKNQKQKTKGQEPLINTYSPAFLPKNQKLKTKNVLPENQKLKINVSLWPTSTMA